MATIVGLGNPGEKYNMTRHNAGALAVRSFANSVGLPALVDSSKYAGEISEGMLDGVPVRVLLPHTYMNKSGTAVKRVMELEDAGELIVVYDELDMKFGDIRISYGRGSGGHNGIESIIAALGSKDFIRVRIGVAPVTLFDAVKKPKGSERVSKFLLSNFSSREQKKFILISEKVSGVLQSIVTKGKEQAMNEFN